jgi:2-dehydropantoate 2-reductase
LTSARAASQRRKMSLEKIQTLCVFGAGAIGGTLAARLATAPALSGARVSVVARGAHLEAIRQNGLRLRTEKEGKPIVARVAASADPGDLGPQDLVISTLKGHQLPAAATSFAPLLKPTTRLLIIQNGIPFWYFHGDVEPQYKDRRIPALDPGDKLWDGIGPERILGGVVYQPAEIVAPGEVKATGPGHLVIGEPNGAMSDDLKDVSALLETAGWTIVQTPRIRDEIWRKLIGNASFNPISALTRATVTEMADDPLVADVIRRVMEDVIAVAKGLGAEVTVTAEQRVVMSRGLGPVRSSMLQDVLAGRALELTPLVRAVSLLGAMIGVPTPTLDLIYALTRRLDESVRA